MTEIKFIKLNSGDDIICEVQRVVEDGLWIIRPFQFVYMTDPRNGTQLSTVRTWLPSHGMMMKPVFLPESAILTEIEPSDSMTQFYLGACHQAESSGDQEEEESRRMREENPDREYLRVGEEDYSTIQYLYDLKTGNRILN